MPMLRVTELTKKRIDDLKECNGHTTHDSVIHSLLDLHDVMGYFAKTRGGGVEERFYSDEEIDGHFKWLEEQRKKREKEREDKGARSDG